ncbi:MAG: Crp/Fnr family transcriptional regulator [Xanthobacteraceae bacterium]
MPVAHLRLTAGIIPMVIQHAVLLPLNTWRLIEMRKLLADVKAASSSDLSLDWLKSFMERYNMRAGEFLFRKGDSANTLFVIASGRCRLPGLGIELERGAVVGELGLLTPGRTRTQDLECTESGIVLQCDYSRIEQLYFQNPEFGFYFLRLASARLLDNLSRAETKLAEREAELVELRGKLAAVQTVGGAAASPA